MTPSHYQQAIFDFVSRESASGLVEAVAGSGKTTTIVEASKLLSTSAQTASLLDSIQATENANSLFVAFNKHIAEALKTKLPASCQAATLHSVGFSLCRSQLGTKKLDQYKVSKILTTLGLADPWKLTDKKEKARAFALRSSAEAMVSIAKATLYNDEREDSLRDVCDFYNIEIADPMLVGTAEQALNLCRTQVETCDFDDMYWLPLANDCFFPSYRTVFVDEFQDMSKAQNEFIKRFESRVLAVGDRNQSLYGFRGANPAAMDDFKTALNAKEFPLSISYRCPRAVIQLAQTLVPQIEAWEKAEEGLVESLPIKFLADRTAEGDMIICRFNAPLLPTVFDLIKRGIKATIRGRDIGKQIADFARKFFVGVSSGEQGLKDACKMMKEHVDRECSGIISTKKHQALKDKEAVILYVAQKLHDAWEVPKFIDDLFSDDKQAITLSSIHRAKGLEADRVFLLQTDDPFADSRQEWEEKQEKNCSYVAYTRAKRELYLVSED